MDHVIRQARSFSIDRRRAVQLSAASTGIAAFSYRAAAAQADATSGASPVADGDVPVSGEAVPELADFDALMVEAMPKWNLPGGQLAIAHEGRLVYNRGFGYASVEDNEAVAPEMTFRIASTTKPVTAVAILKLIDAGELTLDTPVFPLLALEPPPDAPRDPRLDTITVEQLLVHSGGWNSAANNNDPQHLPWPVMASHLLEAENPAEAETIIRYVLSKPLEFDPGTLSAYSNFGFNVLGRVIEHLSGQDYEQFVLEEVLTPAGATSMAIGGTTLAERIDGEVRYYSPPDLPPAPSVYPGEGFVPAGYGSYYMQSLDAHGGWIAAAADLLRFTLAVDGARGEALLSPESVTALETTQRPPSAAAGAGNVEGGFGLGWNSAPVDGGYEWSHAGALEGSNCSWVVRKPGGTALALVFNSLPTDFGAFFGETFPAMLELLAGTTEWPETDLFG
ncbi:MAG: beta-lactamase family protein [Chloroflexota bacterium]|nr:beta-lactamase family protein [Chloroflexota bacterium]